MSYNDTVLAVCKDLQIPINEAWQTGLLEREPLPLLEYLTSYNNPMRPIVSPGSGKVRAIEVTHFQRRAEDEVSEVSTRSCVATTAPTQATAEYEIDPSDILSTDSLIAADTLNDWCGNNPELFQGEIMRMLDVMRRKVATRVAEETALLTGNFSSDVTVDGNNAFVVATLRADGTVDPNTMEEIEFALVQQTGYTLPYAVIGGRDLYKNYRLMEQGCCSSEGLMLDGIFNTFGYAAMYDKRLVTALSGTGADSLSIRQGALQVLNYVQAPWKDGVLVTDLQVGSNYSSQVITDPVTGLLFELRVADNCGSISLVMNTVVKTVSLPNNLYKVGDDYWGVNYVNKLKVTNP